MDNLRSSLRSGINIKNKHLQARRGGERVDSLSVNRLAVQERLKIQEDLNKELRLQD